MKSTSISRTRRRLGVLQPWRITLEGPHNPENPRLIVLRRDVEHRVLKPLRSYGWSATVESSIDPVNIVEIMIDTGSVTTRIAVLYSGRAISSEQYISLSTRVSHIFVRGHPNTLNSYAKGVEIPIDPLDDFFSFLISLNKQGDPDRSESAIVPRKTRGTLRLTAENPIDAIFSRLEQFTSIHLAARLVKRRSTIEGIPLSNQMVDHKATGVAYSMRSALDYFGSTPSDKLNKRVLSLYYGTMAFAQAEMLAAPSGPRDLDEVEGMTKYGHGLYTVPGPNGGFGDLYVGVIANGFLPQWMKSLGYDTSRYPSKKRQTAKDLNTLHTDMVCEIRDLFASIPEIDDLFAEVFGGPANWLLVYYDTMEAAAMTNEQDSTYVKLAHRSGGIPVDRFLSAGWPLSEIKQVVDHEQGGTVFQARVDHVGHEYWWGALPTYSSPFLTGHALILPTLGGIREYRTIAAVILYALSIMARYMPCAWRRIEGGDEDHYLALVKAALAVWERVLPEQFLERVVGERVHTAQPGSWLA